MKAIKEHIGGIVTCLVELLVGILLLISPVGFTSAIIIVVGVVLLVMGLLNILRYFRASQTQAAMSQNLAMGLLYVAAGLFCVLDYPWFIATFPVLTILYGVANLFSGFFKVQFTVDAARRKDKWMWPAISALLTLILAAVILLDPFSTTAILWTFTAVTMIVEAIVDVVTMILSSVQGKSKDSVPEKSQPYQD